MRKSFTLVTGPAKEPLTLAEVKAWAKIDHTDEDALLATLITAAVDSAQEYTRRSFLTQTWRLTIDMGRNHLYNSLEAGTYHMPVTELYGGLPNTIDLPKGPVQSVTSVVTYNTSNASATYSNTNYFLDDAGARLVLNSSAVWPSDLRPAATCVITYVAGYGDDPSDIPQAIRTAMLMHVQRMYDERIVCELPEGCERLLRQYRYMGERHG